MKYLTDFAGVSHEGETFDAVGGVVDIPDEHAGRFADLIAAGALVPIADDVKPAKSGRKPRARKADAPPPDGSKAEDDGDDDNAEDDSEID